MTRQRCRIHAASHATPDRGLRRQRKSTRPTGPLRTLTCVPARRPHLAAARRAAGLTQEGLAHRVGVDRTTVGRWEAGQTDPHLWARTRLAEQLQLPQAQLDVILGNIVAQSPALDHTGELEALELTRRAAATDVGEATLVQLEQAVDDLASSYATSRPADLLGRTRGHLGYVADLLDGRNTLGEHRRLLVAGGWLSLLAATLHVDLQQQAPSMARLRTADSLAREADHDEIRAWCLETEAWRLLTLGEYRDTAGLARGAQELAPPGSSALIQATAQEGRAAARLGDSRATTLAVSRVNRMAGPLHTPGRPEHHYVYDPAKATSYTATTLSWVGDPAAVDHAREVISHLDGGEHAGGRPRRLAVARLDLALALLRTGEVDEAAQSALDAILSGHVAPSSRWRALEVIRATEAASISTAPQVRDAFRQLERATPT